jgi:hypothetical protein
MKPVTHVNLLAVILVGCGGDPIHKAMTEDQFWSIISQTTATTHGSERVRLLKAALAKLSTTEVLSFAITFHHKMCDSYRGDLWAVAAVTAGAMGDDAFEYARAHLVCCGREVFEAAMREPLTAEQAFSPSGPSPVPSPLQNSMDTDVWTGDELLTAPLEVYKTKTGETPQVDFFAIRAYSQDPRDDLLGDESKIHEAYPDLARRYSWGK